jgi:hypothetical protein
MESEVFIDVNYFKANTSVTQNVSAHNIKVAINKAQRLHIVNLLGRKLYDKVLNDISTSALTGDYKVLVDDYVSPSLVEWTLFEGYDSFWARISERGVAVDNSENSTPLTKGDMVYLKDGIRNSAELFDQKCIDYLIFNYNQGKFQEYKANVNSNEERPEGTTFFSGIYISPENRAGQKNCDFPF